MSLPTAGLSAASPCGGCIFCLEMRERRSFFCRDGIRRTVAFQMVAHTERPFHRGENRNRCETGTVCDPGKEIGLGREKKAGEKQAEEEGVPQGFLFERREVPENERPVQLPSVPEDILEAAASEDRIISEAAEASDGTSGGGEDNLPARRKSLRSTIFLRFPFT